MASGLIKINGATNGASGNVSGVKSIQIKGWTTSHTIGLSGDSIAKGLSDRYFIGFAGLMNTNVPNNIAI